MQAQKQTTYIRTNDKKHKHIHRRKHRHKRQTRNTQAQHKKHTHTDANDTDTHRKPSQAGSGHPCHRKVRRPRHSSRCQSLRKTLLAAEAKKSEEVNEMRGGGVWLVKVAGTNSLSVLESLSTLTKSPHTCFGGCAVFWKGEGKMGS